MQSIGIVLCFPWAVGLLFERFSNIHQPPTIQIVWFTTTHPWKIRSDVTMKLSLISPSRINNFVLCFPNFSFHSPSIDSQLSDFTFIFHFPALEKEMATHSSVLAWRIPGMGEPGGLPSMGSHRVGHDWSDLAAAALIPYYVHITVQHDKDTWAYLGS